MWTKDIVQKVLRRILILMSMIKGLNNSQVQISRLLLHLILKK